MATFTVLNANDAGAGSLRQAILDSEAAAGADEIVFDAAMDNQVITLDQFSGPLQITSGEVIIRGDIEGDGDIDIFLSGGGVTGFFNVGAGATATIDSLYMTNGNVDYSGFGNLNAYAITNAGSLSITNSLIASTSVASGNGYYGGPYSGGGNAGNAAIISSSGTLNIVDTAFELNSATGGTGGPGSSNTYLGYYGGNGGQAAVILSSGALNLQNSDLRSNTLTGGAGGAGGIYQQFLMMPDGNGGYYYLPGTNGAGGAGGDAGLVINAGIVRGEFMQINHAGIINAGDGGLGGNSGGIYGGPDGPDGAALAGVLNVGAGTSVGVDNHAGQTNYFLTIGSDVPAGTAGSDVMFGLGGNDVLDGEGGNDDLAGGAGNDQLNGDADNDTIEGGDGDDIMDGGTHGAAGDTVSFAGFIASPGTSGGISVNLSVAGVQNTGAGADTLTNFENVIGSDYNDSITGSAGINFLRGGNGADTFDIDSGLADVAGEVFDGGDGFDTLAFSGGSGITNLRNDTVLSIGALTLLDPGIGGSRTIQLNANQLNVAGINNLGVVNLDGYSDSSETLDIAMGVVTNFDFSGMVFNGYTASARVIITGDGSSETITGSVIRDMLIGGLGNDTLAGGLGADALDGGGGLGDTAVYTNSDAAVSVGINVGGTAGGGHATGDTLTDIENLTGSAFGDTLTGSTGQNVLRGNGGDDSLNGSNNNDQLFGGDGDDTLIGSEGADIINGGTNTAVGDTVSYTNSAGFVTVDLLAGTATGSGHGTGDTLIGIENIIGSAFDDSLTGNNLSNVLTGGSGLDTLTGRGGADTLNGQNGDDTFIGGGGADSNNGGGGTHDKMDYAASGAAVSVDLRPAGLGVGGDAQNDIWTGIEDVTGSAFGDTLIGSSVANILLGGLGDDLFSGGAGADTLNGGGGTHDAAYYESSTAGVNVDLLAGTASGGHAAGDVLIGIEDLYGSNFNDTLTGNNLVNFLFGGGGDDTLNGNGNGDNLNGGAGDDTLNGGGGADTFTFQAAWEDDTINGWVNGQDRIQAVGGVLLTHADFTETQVGLDTLLTLTADPTRTILITNTQATTIDQADFL